MPRRRYELDESEPFEEIRNPCQMVLSGKAGSRGQLLNVRCTCYAEIDRRVSRNYFNYDPIGVAGTIEEAKALYAGHTPHVWRRRRYRAPG